MEKTKICIKCKEEKPLSKEYFYTNKTYKDGFGGTCKVCLSKYYQENKERYKMYYQENKESIKYYYEENKEKHYHKLNYVPKERKSHKYKCLFCGEEFTSKSTLARFCSASCNGKYNRRLKKKYCINCNKEIDITREKFCDDDCRNEYYIKNPKYTKKCIWCGVEFGTNTKKQKLCSTDCQYEYEQDRSLKAFQKQFKKKFETKYPNFKYISGYVNDRSMILCKCNKCGEVQEKIAQLARPSYTRELSCSRCVEINKIKRSLINILMRRHNDLVREQNRIAREKEKEEEKEAHRLQRLEQLKDRVCKECGKVFDAVHEGQIYCSDDCKRKFSNRAREVRKRWRLIDNGKVDWSISLNKLIKRDNNICHICGGKCNKEDYIKNEQGHFIVGKDYPSIDHVIPVSKGGTHTWDNIKLAHHYCNSIKSDKEVYEEGNGQLIIAI